MAVEDKYVDADLAAGKLAKGALSQGAETITVVATVEIAAGDDDDSVYRLFKSVPSTYVPVEITIATDGITGGTDYDLGLYEVGVGKDVVDADILMDGQTMASALTRATGHQLGLQTVDIANIGKTLGELAVIGAASEAIESYDIALTANTVGTAAGTISVLAVFAQG
jgi:hypothetical protein